MNLLDRFIGYFNPVAGVERQKARLTHAALSEAKLAYDAASYGKRTAGWRAVATDANAEIAFHGQRLKQVANDMVRNNPHAARAIQVISEGVVGSGIIPNVTSKVKDYQESLFKRVKAHCDTTAIDAAGRHTLYGLQNLIMRAVAESGEVFVRRRLRRPEDGLPLPFQLQVLESDYLDRRVEFASPAGGYAVNGIEFDAFGRRIAYHFYAEHPGSRLQTRMPETVRVPAGDVAHVYRVDRPGQINGVTWFAPVALAFRDYADYADAQLVRQKIAACFAVFIKSQDSGSPFASKDKSGETDLPLESVEPGMIERLRPGDDVSFGMPPTVEGFRDYSTVTKMEMAVGLGIDYASLTGDNSQSNFANSRMGWLRFQRSIEGWQYHMLIPSFCDPVGRWILDAFAAVDGRRIPATVNWTPPRREMFDPSKDMIAAREAIAAGLSSRPYEQRRLGFDPEDLDADIAASNKRADAGGMRFTSDGRFAVKMPENAPEKQEQSANDA